MGDMQKNAFTIIELMIALFILSIGISGAFIVLRDISVASSISTSRLTAVFLAQEGIEVIRNIRDYNWAKGVEWDTNIDETTDTRLQYDSDKFPDTDITSCGTAGHPCFLAVYPGEEKGFFMCRPAGEFKRTITVEKKDLNGDGKDDKMHVISEVEWQQRGRTFKVYAVEDLYNWWRAQ